MSIPVTCNQCEKHYDVDEKGAGRKFRCKGCGAVLIVPDMPAETAPAAPPKAMPVANVARQKSSNAASDTAERPAKSASQADRPVKRRRADAENSEGETTAARSTRTRKASNDKSKPGSKSQSGSAKKRVRSGAKSAAGETKSRTRKKSSSRSGSSAGKKSGSRKAKSRAGAAPAKDYELYDDVFEEDDAYEVSGEADGGYEDYESYDDYSEDYGEDYGDYEADYDDYEATPRRSAPARKKKKKKSKSQSGGGFSNPLAGLAMGFNLNRLNLALAIIGGLCIFLGVNEARLAASAKSEPSTISAADLVANGPGDNIYVTVTDVDGDLDETVYEATERHGVERVDACYVPARPIGADATSAVRLIIYSDDVSSEMDIVGVAGGRQHTGLIVNDIMSISGEKRQLLETMPNLNVDNAYILQVGRTPSGAALVVLYFVGGAVLLAGGLFWIFFIHE